MYIQRIIIQGFKTYKNTTIIDVLSPNHNVVVGRNGSGKSNFFAAIRFVLSDAYTHMTREERQGLIHEGSGTVMSAYVEIIFNNSDGRFPTNKSEVSIRRTIGLKKDDYSLDGKSATRSDIMNLLESAGFSRSNPYYIVPQGRITALTNSKDSERLTLLKEVSGATVFESKLKESMKEMENSNFKEQRINETLLSIDGRLADLQIESADLKKFQSLERSKKILEYNIFDRELNELNSSVEVIDERYSQLLENSKKDLEELDKREKLCQQLSDTMKDLKISLRMASLEKEQSDIDYNGLLNTISEKEFKLDELKKVNEESRQRYNDLQNSIKRYEDMVQHNKQKMLEYRPEIESLRKHEDAIQSRLASLLSSQRAIYSKQCRFSKFRNKKERDSWLKKEVSTLSSSLREKERDLSSINDEIKSKEDELAELNSEIEHSISRVEDADLSKLEAELKSKISSMKDQISNLTDQRKVLWREEIKLKSVHDSVENDLNNANHVVNSTMDRLQAQGLSAVKAITEKLKLQDSVYGPVAELFNVSDKYKTTVEVIAGNSLFHVVVDSDKTAGLIMDELVKTKSGRVTFMPLNRLQPSHTEYPDGNEYQCIPLIKKLKYDNEAVGKAIRQIFGKTIVCSDLQTGSELARSFGLVAITLDGDKADTKGALSGGFRDYKNSRLDALKTQLKKRKELVNTKKALDECTKNVDIVNRDMTTANNELQTSLRALDKLVDSQEPIKMKLSTLENKKYDTESELASLRESSTPLTQIINNLSKSISNHQAELKSKFTQILSDEEQRLLQELNQKIQMTEGELDTVVTKLAEIESIVSGFESELNDNYLPNLSKMLKEQRLPQKGMDEAQTRELNSSLRLLRAELDEVSSKRQTASEEHLRITNELNMNEEALQRANQQQIEIMKHLEEFSKISEKELSKKSIHLSRRDEVQKSIRELGVLPEEAFHQENYSKIKSDQLLKKLKKINEDLSKFSHINKKALEQYNTFTKQRDELVSRKQELEKSKESIENLIQNLQAQKDGAITTSFKQVSKSFHEIFEKLVPNGIGHLIMQKRAASAIAEGDSDDEQDAGANVENYIGVSISVSFNSKSDEQQRIEQLSGGQKSLCAIALILAIQKSDPAPFYLFDEIDANLDTQYRTAVANMINSLAVNAQFICTTFRPEMLQVADKFYGVMFSNKVSTVSEINKEDAMNFVEGQQHH